MSANKGRAVGETPTAVIHNATAVAPVSFFPDSSPSPRTYTHTHTSMLPVGDTVVCPLCTDILDRPIQLSCDRMVCLGCVIKWIQISGQLTCPCCFDHSLNSDHIKRPSTFTMDILGSLLVVCQVCTRSVQTQHYSKHLSSMCSAHRAPVDSPSKTTIRDIL